MEGKQAPLSYPEVCNLQVFQQSVKVAFFFLDLFQLLRTCYRHLAFLYCHIAIELCPAISAGMCSMTRLLPTMWP